MKIIGIKNIILVVVLLVTFSTFGQQEPQFTQFMYNTISVNPGYAGTRGTTSLFGLHRRQWIGLVGAPTTSQFSIHAPVSYKGHGMGLTIVNDEIGPSTDTYLNASFAYKLQVSRGVWLNMAIMGGGGFLTVNYNDLDIYDKDDHLLTGSLSKFSPNIGAGLYLYSDKWYAGISVPSILETQFYDDIQQSIASERMHFYFMAGYVFDLNPNLKFKPATIVKAVSGAPVAVDLTANFLIHRRFTVGAAYRWDAAVSALAGFEVTPGLQIGYAYDHDTHNMGNYNAGSHEIFIRFDFISSRGSMVNPRFF